MTDEELIRCFEAAEDPPGGFHHHEHVRVAWWYVRQVPLLTALERFRRGLVRFAEARGASTKYHETITIAFLLLVHERAHHAPEESWDQFAARSADLLAWNPSILDRYYHPETLASERARRSFVWPDRV
jgi:hypothetical protein